jgi:hypothetical protein
MPDAQIGALYGISFNRLQQIITEAYGVSVSSDINTMKVALRAGLLRTDIPLLSSFLDIFCYQYTYIDEMSAKAWRTVWQEWRELDAASAPLSPCQMDFLLYRIGREYCDEKVVLYTCQQGHKFHHFGGRLRKCRLCPGASRLPARPVGRFLPCQLDPAQLPREGGKLLIGDKNLLTTFQGVCILEGACQPKTETFRALNPPKSISIKGETSWTQSYSYKDKGGGGMMG